MGGLGSGGAGLGGRLAWLLAQPVPEMLTPTVPVQLPLPWQPSRSVYTPAVLAVYWKYEHTPHQSSLLATVVAASSPSSRRYVSPLQALPTTLQPALTVCPAHRKILQVGSEALAALLEPLVAYGGQLLVVGPLAPETAVETAAGKGLGGGGGELALALALPVQANCRPVTTALAPMAGASTELLV